MSAPSAPAPVTMATAMSAVSRSSDRWRSRPRWSWISPTLDEILHQEVIERLDHKHLNHAVAEFTYGNTVPTAEAVAVYLWQRIQDRLPDGVHLHRVLIQEDPLLCAEYFGP